MGSVGTVTWLQKLDEQLNVDVDWLDPEYVQNMPIKPHDMTSNQLWVDIELNSPNNVQMVEKVVRECKNDGWLRIYTRIAVLLTKINIDHIKGRVLLQVLPSEAYNTDAIIRHARMYDEEFSRAGISRDRFCIKIPSTGPALIGAKILEAEGIRTLGTALFSLPQAIACSQAGCLYISPYYNEVRAHDDLKLWPNVEDPATQHTMSARLVQILETYRQLYKETGKEQPFLKNASFISPKEAMAAGEMGCHSATISHTVLNELAALTYDGTAQPAEGRPKPPHAYKTATPLSPRLAKIAKTDPLAPADWDGKLADAKTDYLADNGAALRRAIAADPATQQRLNDALDLFKGGEARSRVKIEAMMQKQ